MLRRDPPSVALGAPTSTRETEDPIRPEGTDFTIPVLMATLTQMSLWAATPDSTPRFTHINSPTAPANHTENTGGSEHEHIPHRVVLAGLSDKLLLLQEKMNVALEQLLTNRATRDFCCKELDLNTELAAHLNNAQAVEAIKQAEVHHATTACALQ